MKKTATCLTCHNTFEYRETQSYGKYCSNKCQGSKKSATIKRSIEDTQDGKGHGIRTVKRYLIEIRGHKCEMCQLTHWMNKPLVIILDHVDGNSENWKLDNLRLICSNCDSTLPTYKKRNVGNGRFSRRKRYAEGLSC